MPLAQQCGRVHSLVMGNASKWVDRGSCACHSLDLETEDAIAAAYSIGTGTLSARSLLARFSAKSLLDAYRTLSECMELECVVHSGDELRSACTELVSALGDAA